jgi:drug/metabolite transporter (DMT)-like permease
LVPLFTLAVGALFFGKRFNKLQAAGVFAGLCGATLLLSPWNAGPTSNAIYGLFPILGTVMYAISVNTIGQKLAHLSPLGLTLLSFTIVGIPATLLLFAATDFVDILRTEPGVWSSLGYIAILGTLSSSISVVLFNRLIQMTSPIFASTITYFVPMVALMWGAFDGERIGWFHLAGMGLILAGVYLVNKKRLSA